MSKRSLGFIAAAAAIAAFSGLHLEIASGRSLEPLPPDARLQTGRTFAANNVDRSTKADRGEFAPSSAEGRTITFQHPDLASTTVALRLWETAGAAKSRPELKAPSKDGKAPGDKPKRIVACEGVVSVLTEVAKQLDAGRCLT
jgi:hypothetical protein